ncbi:MAG: hypothetical protein JXX29_11890 [Deltaproteobacteria bacterium]|nr:hypothetical protein [Deltaproteobacteria bacterium]MBN2672375.1 hypothetical protein [Deltaproteobacteria bacterium]
MSVFRFLVFMLLLEIPACVVSDEIEFTDKLNMPPRLESVSPPVDTVNTAMINSSKTFTIVLWDPDEEDATLYGGAYDGYVKVIEQLNSSQTRTLSFRCERIDYSDPDLSRYEGGVMVTLTCTARFELNASDMTSVIVQAEISDRGFLDQDELELPDGANPFRVNWTFEMFPEDIAATDEEVGK